MKYTCFTEYEGATKQIGDVDHAAVPGMDNRALYYALALTASTEGVRLIQWETDDGVTHILRRKEEEPHGT